MYVKNISKKLVIGLLFGAVLLVGTSAIAEAQEKAVDNYKLMCVQCHGLAGTGKGINAPALAVQPRNHTSAKDMSTLSDDNVFKAIKEGGIAVGKSNQMPAFGALMSDAEVKDLVKHLRGMCKCKGPA